MTFIIFVVVVVLGVVAWKMRVQLLSKILGQDETRIRRQIERRKR